jgi:hypothetical protein
MQNIGWPATVWSCWHLYCSIYAAAHWTDLRSCTGTGSQHNQPAERMLQAGSKAISHKVLAMSAVPASCTPAWSLLRTLAYGMHSRRKRMFERRQATQQSTQEGDSTRVELVYQCLRLAMLGSHSQLAETQCMIQLYLQQQSSATC